MAYTGHDLGAIALDFHAPAPSVALLSTPKLMVDGINGNRDAGGQSGKGGNQAFAVGLTRGLESEHSKTFMLAGTFVVIQKSDVCRLQRESGRRHRRRQRDWFSGSARAGGRR